MRKAVIVLSGGLDSTVCMSEAMKEGYLLCPITFTYGQQHEKEVEHARKVARHYGCKNHLVVDVGFFRDIGGSALTSDNINIPTNRTTEEMSEQVPSTYVPFRNGVFLALAASYAESLRARKIYTGVNAVDYSGYPDCRPEFIESFQQAINTGTAIAREKHPIEIATPLINLTKKEIVELGIKNGAPLHLTTSCYYGGEKACGKCDSCQLRLKGFTEAGTKDPIEYES